MPTNRPITYPQGNNENLLQINRVMKQVKKELTSEGTAIDRKVNFAITHNTNTTKNQATAVSNRLSINSSCKVVR